MAEEKPSLEDFRPFRDSRTEDSDAQVSEVIEKGQAAIDHCRRENPDPETGAGDPSGPTMP